MKVTTSLVLEDKNYLDKNNKKIYNQYILKSTEEEE
jgi:hypothetical protein